MDDDDDGFRNWGYYEPSFKGHLNLQLMPSVIERDTKPFLPGCGGYHHSPQQQPLQYQQLNNHHIHPHYTHEFAVSESPRHLQHTRETWVAHQRDKLMSIMPGNPSFGVMPEAPGAHSLHMFEQPVVPNTEILVRKDDPVPQKVGGPKRKRQGGGAPKMPKMKKPKKGPTVPKENGNGSSQCVKPSKKNVGVVINGIDMDISNIPIPVCTCTGTPQQCYRWGCGGWQSACCTTSISLYPLPMSTKRRGARIAGRKMSLGAFKKVLEKLSSEGYDFSHPIDLKRQWAKHGTNKFVTIR